jgi:hypothetical protein
MATTERLSLKRATSLWLASPLVVGCIAPTVVGGNNDGEGGATIAGSGPSSGGSGGALSTVITVGVGGTDPTTITVGAGGAPSTTTTGAGGDPTTITVGSGGSLSTNTTGTGGSDPCLFELCTGNIPSLQCRMQYQASVDPTVALLPFCAGLWSDDCTRMATAFGLDCKSERQCPHEPWETGLALNPECDLFEVGHPFCNANPSCCTVAWTDACVSAWNVASGNPTVGPCNASLGADPEGCFMDYDCPQGQQCIPSGTCKPSACSCVNGANGWERACSNDCGGGVCSP